MPTAETAKQRRLARGILGALASTLVLFVLFATGPGLGLSFAQQPTPSFKISFLNPSGHSEEISAKNDGTNDTYHLVAWVNEVPANAGVVFAYEGDNGEEIEIGTGTQTGIPDTFDFHWTVPAELSDGPITLYAILYSGSTELARDTESDLTLNNANPEPGDTEPENRGETVEITYPAVGGAFGFYTPRDRQAAGVLEVTRSASASTIRVFFTTAAPGNEPTWTQCGSESASNAANGVRCTLPLGRDSSTVTALAATAFDAPVPQTTNTDSGDAHRIAPYGQVPTNVSINPSTQSVSAGNCSEPIAVTVTDQNSIPIASADVDVHAVGPSDDLAFGDDAQPPEQNHAKEPARDCTSEPDPPASGQQGQHENTAGNDLKHVEAPAGTNDDGVWTFQLFSPVAGSTQFTAWVDGDSDDVFCSAEVNASGAVGWQEGLPGITGVPADTSDCPQPSPTSPNPGPSTPGPTPTNTGSPDNRGCTITGTSGSEQVSGTPDDDVICAGDGDDIVRGLGGNDTIYGEGGRDDIRGGAGNDVIRGGSDKDTIRGNGGSDRLLGQNDNDVLTGGTGNDNADGGAGFDTVRGSGGRDTLNGRGGADNLTGGGANDTLRGGPGKDTLAGGGGRDSCFGGGGRDSYRSCERGQRR